MSGEPETGSPRIHWGRWRTPALVLLVVALAWGHYAYWYGPRLRQGIPGDGPAAQLLRQPGYSVALWTPFPHQNLAALRADAGLDGESLRAALELAQLPTPDLPGFGRMSLPPSSALAVATDDIGSRFVVAAEVYPTFAAFAKLSGLVTGNPWLRGGEIVVEGRRMVVAWEGSLWRVASPELPALDGGPPVATVGGEAVAWLSVRQAADPLPAGDYRLSLDPRRGRLELASGGRGAEAEEDLVAATPLDPRGDAFLLALAGRRELFGEPLQAMVFFPQPVAEGAEMPRSAVLFEPGGDRWELPAEGLLGLAGREPAEASQAGFSIAALDEEGLAGARLLASGLRSWVGEDGSGAPVLGLWMHLDPAQRELGRLVSGLEGAPLVSRRRVDRWRHAHSVVAAVADRFDLLTLEVTEEPRALRLRMERIEDP
ncbi:MAG: hypothetical protein AAGD06_08495 [Acidobacteriota bacterium]